MSVELCKRARDDFWAIEANRVNRIKPLVAAAVGPYGAHLLNGEVFKGSYELTEKEYMDHHRWSIKTLLKGEPDVLAFETFPRLDEVKAICKLMAEEFPEQCAYIAFCARDGEVISNGDHIRDCAAFCDSFDQVVCFGVNCTGPKNVSSLIKHI